MSEYVSAFADNSRLGECSEWSDETLVNKAIHYQRQLETPNLMPRARAVAQRILTHVNFELDYRYGIPMTTEAKEQAAA